MYGEEWLVMRGANGLIGEDKVQIQERYFL